ncbi:MAG: ATP-grasp domain-containing protein [bacterium]|nr:ATP-grasp domain-containing protein [bacterium]
MSEKKHQTEIATIFIRFAKKYGVKIVVEPEYGYVMQITNKQGKKVYVRGTVFPLNNLGAAAVARDKGNTTFFLKKMGYHVPKGQAFYSEAWGKQIGSKDTVKEALKYAQKIGWPVIIKPNDASGGELVFLCNNMKEFLQATTLITPKHDIFVVQEYVQGFDYRLLVLDGKVVAAYQRLPLSVVGDGVNTIRKLFKEENVKQNNYTDVLSARILATLRQQKLDWSIVLKKGRTVELLPSANLSSGGRALDVLENLYSDWKIIAQNIARDLDLRYCGIDIISQKPLSEKSGKYVVLEVNASPGISGFAMSGKTQKKKAEEIYEKIFLKII